MIKNREEPQSRTGRGPVFILAGGFRTGSTLVQRLLVSTGEIMIWGEHDGLMVGHLLPLVSGIQDLNKGDAKGQFETFQTQGFNAWIANMNPEVDAFLAASRAYFRQALAEPARKLGYPRWGFKEVRYGASAAQFLQMLFPNAAFVMLVRNPKSCLLSLKATHWGSRVLKHGPRDFLRDWTILSRELSEVKPKLKKCVLMRYEDLVDNPVKAVAQIAVVTEITESSFRTAEVLSEVNRGTTESPTELVQTEKDALNHPDVRQVAEFYEYD